MRSLSHERVARSMAPRDATLRVGGVTSAPVLLGLGVVLVLWLLYSVVIV